MRKVLLATTALVAMGGVSAASAEISHWAVPLHTTTSPTLVLALRAPLQAQLMLSHVT